MRGIPACELPWTTEATNFDAEPIRKVPNGHHARGGILPLRVTARGNVRGLLPRAVGDKSVAGESAYRVS